MSRWLKFLVLPLAVLAIAGYASYQWFTQSKLPQHDGTLALTGINAEVRVWFDQWGIPHIDANDQLDAWTALGYLHAQERFFQMDVLRRIGSGRLAEIFGEQALDGDRFFRTLGVNRFADYYVDQVLDPNSEQAKKMRAYASGINQYLRRNPQPIEYDILGVEPEPYTLKDMTAVYGYMAYSFAKAFKTDPLMTSIQHTLGEDYLADLEFYSSSFTPKVATTPSYVGSEYASANTENPRLQLTKATKEMLWRITETVSRITDQGMPVGWFHGSNSWVVSGTLNPTGAPILANDPHMSFGAPSVWFEAHVRTPDFEVYGSFLAGMPFPILGTTRDFAYGLTMLENDDIDLYLETFNEDGSQVKFRGDWVPIKTVTETLNVKDGEPETIKVQITPHGPVINSVVGALYEQAQPVSVMWTYLDRRNDPFAAVSRMPWVDSMTEFADALSRHWAPGLNVNYADRQGNIAMWATAKLLKRPPHVHGHTILDGASGRDEPKGYWDFSANPRVVNPDSGYLYSANHAYSEQFHPKVPGYYVGGYRALALEEAFKTRSSWDMASLKALQTDVSHPRIELMGEVIFPLLQQAELSDQAQPWLDRLRNWDTVHHLDSQEATVFEHFYYRLLRNIFVDELGEARWQSFKRSHVMTKSVIDLVNNPDSPWWDNKTTKATKESLPDIVVTSFNQAIADLHDRLGEPSEAWHWGQHHQLTHHHSLGQVEPLDRLFNVGPFAVPGNHGTINHMMHRLSNLNYQVVTGPSTRRLIPLANVNEALAVNPTGQSGVPLSPHYRDQAPLHVSGEYRSQLMNWQKIKALPNRLRIKPD